MRRLERINDIKIGHIFLDSGHKWKVIDIRFSTFDSISRILVRTICSCEHGKVERVVNPLIFIDKEIEETARVIKII